MEPKAKAQKKVKNEKMAAKREVKTQTRFDSSFKESTKSDTTKESLYWSYFQNFPDKSVPFNCVF